jgi:nucleoid DNA-binding protein
LLGTQLPIFSFLRYDHERNGLVVIFAAILAATLLMAGSLRAATSAEDVVATIAARTGSSEGQVDSVLDAAWQVIAESLEQGESVQFENFGRFAVRHRAARHGRNPKSGEEVVIPPKAVVAFEPSPALQRRLSESRRRPGGPEEDEGKQVAAEGTHSRAMYRHRSP